MGLIKIKEYDQKFRELGGSKRGAASFVLILGVFSFFSHQVFIYSGWSINPDESELLATARLASKPGGFYANYTTSTFGPVWPELLALLNHIGMQLDHFNAHRLAIIMKMIIFLTPQYLAIRQLGFTKLFLVLIPLNLVLFVPTSNEFTFLSTELLPLLFLTLAVVIILYVKNEISLIVAGVLFALAVLSKYQSLLMILILISFIFVRYISNGSLDSRKFYVAISKFGLSILVSFVFFFISLNYSKTLEVFVNDSLFTAIRYSTSGSMGGGASFFNKLQVGSSLLTGQPLIAVVLLLILMVIQSDTLHSSTFRFSNRRIEFSSVTYMLFIIFCCIGFLTISIPGNWFPHYLLFFIWTQTIFLLIITRLAISQDKKLKTYKEDKVFMNTKYSRATVGLLVLIISLSAVAPIIKGLLNASTTIKYNEVRFKELSSSQVLNFCPANSQVLVWGWSSELFSYFDWTPTQYVVNDVARIKVTGLNKVQIERIVAAVFNKETDCIFEAVGPQYFGGFSASQGLETLPETAVKSLGLNYKRNVLPDGTLVWSRL